MTYTKYSCEHRLVIRMSIFIVETSRGYFIWSCKRACTPLYSHNNHERRWKWQSVATRLKPSWRFWWFAVTDVAHETKWLDIIKHQFKIYIYIERIYCMHKTSHTTANYYPDYIFEYGSRIWIKISNCYLVLIIMTLFQKCMCIYWANTLMIKDDIGIVGHSGSGLGIQIQECRFMLMYSCL